MLKLENGENVGSGQMDCDRHTHKIIAYFVTIWSLLCSSQEKNEIQVD